MIIVDIHEPPYIIESLRKKGAQVNVRKLELGDYIINNLCIERKNIYDLYRSIIDKRLFSQLERLKQTYPNHILLIEGNLFELANKVVNPNMIVGVIVSSVIDFDTKILYSRDVNETVYILYNIWRKLKRQGGRIILRYKPKIISMEDRLIYILEGFPGIGHKLAINILNHYRTLRNFINTTVSELSSVEGIGEKKAREIYKIINTDYRKLKYSSK